MTEPKTKTESGPERKTRSKGGKKSRTRSPGKAEAGTAGNRPDDMRIMRALWASAVPQPETELEQMVWKVYSFDAEKLHAQLKSLVPQASAAVKGRLEAFATEFAARYRLRVSRSGDVPVNLAGKTLYLPRWLVGEALGALGTNLMPTRRRIRRSATEAARELAYFGYGKLGEQLLPHPLALIRGALAGEESLYLEPILLDEGDESVGRRWTVFDLLKSDPFFHRQVDGEAELARFQQFLREDPLDGGMVTNLRRFFSKRATVGLRDTTRWLLGSRHPWFNWKRARDLIDECFDRWGTENFVSPRINLYFPDVSCSAADLERMQAENELAVRSFADALGRKLAPSVAAKFDEYQLLRLAWATLDCHHDHPDFDLEARGRQGGETTARFIGHAIYVLANHFAGRESQPRPNLNLAAHFEDMGIESTWLGHLDPEQRASFYVSLNDLVKEIADQDSLGQGPHLPYRRLPMVMYTFFEGPGPRPRAGEEVLDSFSLADMREPQHAKYLHDQPEVFEKLVVFFTLVLRHYLDTEHVPDLRPENMIRDFMVLGLWGTNTQNLVVNIFRNTETGKTRSEVRFVGRSQVKGYRPDEDRKYEAALARLVFSQFGPLLEPSVLRSVGTFMMAAEERTGGSRVQEMGTIALAKHTLELFRETARTGIKGSLVDVATMLEMLVDNSVDLAQQGLDRFAGTGDK